MRVLKTMTALVIAFVLAATAFAAAFASANRFARLPPAGRALGDLGWPDATAEPVRRPRLVLLDEDGEGAWMVLGNAVCRADGSTWVLSSCRPLQLGAAPRLHHARGGGRLLLVAEEPGVPLVVRATLVYPRSAASEALTWTDSDKEPRERRLANIAWDETRARFSLFFDTLDPLRGTRVVPLTIDREAGSRFAEEEPFPIEPYTLPPRMSRARLVAAFPVDPPAALLFNDWFDAGELYLARDGQLQQLLLAPSECAARGSLLSCTAIASSATFDDTGRFAIWIDPRGVVSRPPAWDGALASSRVAIVAHERASGGEEPIVATQIFAGRESTLTVPFAGARVELASVSRGGEDVLFARKDAGQWSPVAREASLTDPWWAAPGKGGLLLVRGDRAVVLDANLAACEPAPMTTRIKQIAAQRFSRAPLSVIAYFIALLGFAPLLALFAMRILRRKRAGDATARARVTFALAAYAVLAGALIGLEWRALYPP